MDLLLLAHRVPYPPDKGDKIRSFQLLEWLVRKHRVHLVSLVDDPADREHAAVLARLAARVRLLPVRRLPAALRAAGALPGRTPLSVAYAPRRALARAAREVLAAAPVDAVVAFSGQTAPAALALGRPVVLDLVDRDSAKWAQYARWFRGWKGCLFAAEARRLAAAEERWVRAAAATLVVSPAERDLFPPPLQPRITVIRNCLRAGLPAGEARRDDGRTLLFAGALDYPPNVDAVCFFADEVLPRVRQRRRAVRFVVVGRRPARALRRRAARGEFELAGYVPDLTGLYRRAALSVAPFRLAQGLLNKVLEALAAGVPVVATPAAVRGLGLRDGEGVRLAADPEGLAAHVGALLADRAGRTRLGLRGRRWVAARHVWPGEWPRLEEVLARVAGPAATRVG